MSYGARSTVTRQMIWRTTDLRYLIKNRNRAVLFDWVEFISVFSNSCWSNRFQALSDRLCLYQERISNLKVRRTLVTNHCKNTYVGTFTKRTPSIILVTTSQFFKLSKLIDMRKLNVTVSKMWIRKWFCIVRRITQKCQSQSRCHFSVNSMFAA